MDEKQLAAKAALDAHDALRAARDLEPPSSQDAMPIDPDAWLAWRCDISEPAYERWHKAMDELDAALGFEVGRHPFTFRPVCEEVLNGNEVAAMREL